MCDGRSCKIARKHTGPIYLERGGKFHHLDRGGAGGDGAALPSGGALVLVPFRTISVHPFSYPFRSMRDIRNALALKFKPLLSGEEAVEIIPWVSSRSGGALGAAWCLAASEVPGGGAIGAGNVVWPLPLALASAVDGDGIAVFGGDGVLASAVFSEGVPLFCRCSPAAVSPTDEELDREARLCGEFAAATGHEGLAASVWKGKTAADLFAAARDTAARFPSFLSVNILKSALSASLAREKTARALRNFSAAAAVLGLCFCGAELWLSARISASLASLAARSKELYGEIAAPGERVSDPLSQARAKLAELKGSGGEGLSLSSVLSHLGLAWTSEGGEKRPGFPVLELLRYSGDGVELTGAASDMEGVQALRDAAGRDPFRASLGDVQQIPGGGLRFSLSIRRRVP